jgi:hypothetical protein
MMDIQEILSRVAKIEEESWDDEVAHIKEDELRRDFIKHVAESGDKNLAEMASEVLKTEDIDFSRWCA